MKYISSQFANFLKERGVRRNLGSFSRFIVLMLLMIGIYSLLFHSIMAYEGQEYSLLTGIYWTLTVMSTLGFGDITFNSDLGRIFSIVVLISGILCLLVMLPFAFIQLIYTPWVEARKKNLTPRTIPPSVRGHIIVVGISPIVLNVVDALVRYGYACFILAPDSQTALDLIDRGYQAILGAYDDPAVYRELRLDQAAMLVAMDNDMRNTNIAFSARETGSSVPIIARAERVESIDILMLAGCSHVFQFRNLLGRALAHRVLSETTNACVRNHFGPLIIAEAQVMRTSLAGKTIMESDLRRQLGLNVVGIWEKGEFILPQPHTRLTENTILVLAGTEEQIAHFEQEMVIPAPPAAPHAASAPSVGQVLILGGGRVGEAAAQELKAQGIHATVVDMRHRNENSEGLRWVQGDAADLAILEKAGINTAPSVIITTHDDDINIYLTIYCRRLRPDIQIISRASLDRHFSVLHAAGANLVLSLASMITSSLINILAPGKVFLLNEGLNMFRASVGRELVGKTLASSDIRSKTHCNLVAVYDTQGEMHINPDPQYVFQAGDILYLIGNVASENAFYAQYGLEKPETFQASTPALQDFIQAFSADLSPASCNLPSPAPAKKGNEE